MAATVLLVDDEPRIIEMLQDVLESRGYQVLSTINPLRVPALLGDHPAPIDLLLVDVIMPQMPGRELVTLVQQRWPDCRVIFMSGYSPENLPAPGVPAGSQIVMKPIAIGGLLAAVRTALGPETLGAD